MDGLEVHELVVRRILRHGGPHLVERREGGLGRWAGGAHHAKCEEEPGISAVDQLVLAVLRWCTSAVSRGSGRAGGPCAGVPPRSL